LKTIENVFILTAGEGRRLRPDTASTPKPHLSIGAQTILERLLCQLWPIFPSTNLYVNFSYLPTVFLSKIKLIPLEFRPTLIWEPILQGSGNSVHNLSKLVSGPTLIIHGDLVLSRKYITKLQSALLGLEKSTMFCHSRKRFQARSIVELDSSGRITAFCNTAVPQIGGETVLVNSGIYFLPSLENIGGRPSIGVDICDSIIPFLQQRGQLFGERIEEARISVDSAEALIRAKELVIND
jgi:NDP-sugar pyrophosphorylase family protein